MSVLERLENKNETAGKKLFGIVTGTRLAGKSSLAGTLPGHTLMLQAAVLESGSKSALALAAELGNKLTVVSFESVAELQEVLIELADDERFDNVYIDGLSALLELKAKEPKIAQMMKGKGPAVFDGWRELGTAAEDVILALKGLTYPGIVKKPKNTFMTCALDVKHDSDGQVIEVKLAVKGNMAVSSVTRVGEAVLTVLPPQIDSNGKRGSHVLLTRGVGWYPARLDGLLDGQNPGQIEPANLATVISLLEGDK